MMTILIVDDMLDGRTMLATFLEKNGYQVLGTANGKEALEVLEKQSVDLIITDILMPEMDGYMLCKQIKSDKRWMHIPIIIYSATFTTRQDEIFAIKLGANRFVRKPVDTDSFLNIIRNLIEKGSNGTLDVTQLKFKKEEDVFKLYNERIIHKLEDSESRYKSIFENMTIGLYRTTPDGIILMANPALLKMLGYDSLEEMAKRNLEKEGYHSDYSRAKFKSILDKEGKITDWESAWQRKDGSFIFVLESASAFYDNDGKILYYEGSVEDITARKIAEASLQESQNRLSKAAKMAKLGYWDYDVAENLFTFDDHFYAIFHTTAEEVGGYKLTPEEYAKRFLYPDDQELVAAETRKALQTTDPNFSRQLEHRIVYADGGIGWMSINFFIVKDNQGRTIRTFGVNQDITERKKAEGALRESEEKHRIINNNMPVVIYAALPDEHSTNIFLSGQAEELTGYSVQEFMDDNMIWEKIIHPDDVVRVSEAVAKHRRNKSILDVEYRIIKKNNQIVWIHDKAKPLLDEKGNIRQIHGMMEDITERRRMQEMIVQEQKEIKLIIDTSPVLIFYKDKEGRFIRVNNAFAKMLRMDEADFLGKTVFDLYSKEIAQSMTDDDRKVLKSNRPKLNIIEQYQSASGPRWVQTDKIPIQDENGNAVGLIGFALDITDLKQAEEVLRKSEKHYRELINGMTETVWIIDYNGDLIDVNQTALEKLGYTKPELLKIGLYGVDSSLKRENIQALAKSMSKDKIQIFETSHKCKDGSSFPVEVYSSLITYHDKPAILSIARDITERKLADAALRESEERYRSVVEYSQNGILIAGEDFRLIYCNDTLCTLLNRTRAKIVGHDFREFLDEESKDLVADMYLKRRRGEDMPGRYEFSIIREDGEKRRVENSSTIIKDSQGKVLTVAQIMDITERKQAEENIRRITEGAHAILWRGKVTELKDKSEGCLGFAWDVNYINLENIIKFIPLAGTPDRDPGERYHTSILEKDRQAMEKISAKALREKANKYEQEFRLLDANDNLHWMREDVSINRIDETHFELIGVITDITGRKRAEEELRESEERYRLITDNSVDAILLTDPNGPILSANKAACEMFRMTEKEICEVGRHGIVDTEDPRLTELLKKRLRDGFIKGELTMKRKDGSKFTADITSAVFNNSRGEPRTSMIIRDVTERKEYEEALREERDKFARIVNTAPGAICSFCIESDNTAYLTYASPSVKDIFGFTPDELAKDIARLKNYFNPNDAPRVVQEIQESARQLSYLKSEFRYIHPKKGEIWIFASFEPVREGDNKTVWYGIVMDITDRKQAEEDLNQVMESAQAILWHSKVVKQKDANAGEKEFLWETRYFNLEAIKYNIPLPDYPTHNLNDMYYYAILEEDRKAMDRISFNTLKKGIERYSQEFRLRDAKGVIHWMYEEARIKKIGEFQYEVIGVNTEITERKNAEIALRLSEEKFKDLFEYIGSGVVIYQAVDNGADFIIQNLNRASEKIEKVKRDKIIGKSVQQVFSGVKDFGLFEVIQRVWRTGKPESFPLNFYKDNRISGWRENYIFKLPTGEVVVVYDDVTKQKQAEEERLKSERYFRLVWEKSVDGMRLTDENGNVVMTNDTYCNIVNISKKKLEGKPFTVIYAKEQRAQKMEHYLRRFEGHTEQSNFEMEMILQNGKKVWLSLSDSHFEIETGKRLLLTITRDITEQKIRQLEKEELQTQLTQIQKIEAIGNLAGGIAHDFNNLLTVIQGHAQLLLMQKNESDHEYSSLKQIMNTCSKATTLTKQLLLFGRKQTLELKPLNINDTVSNLLKMVQRLIGSNINIVTDFKTPLNNIEADEGNLEQIILNLVVNSRDAMPNGGTLTIKTEDVAITRSDLQKVPNSRTGEFVCFSITDTGIGMSKEIIEKAFDPFFTTKGPGKGTGLGLSVVYGIIKKHNGWINIESEIDRGTTMKVYFPITDKGLSEAIEQPIDSQIYRGRW